MWTNEGQPAVQVLELLELPLSLKLRSSQEGTVKLVQASHNICVMQGLTCQVCSDIRGKYPERGPPQHEL